MVLAGRVGSNPTPGAKIRIRFRLSGLGQMQVHALSFRDFVYKHRRESIDASPTNCSSELFKSSPWRSMSCFLTFHGVCGPTSVRKFSQSLTARNIADATGAALLVFRRGVVFSPLPFLASEILGIIGQSATLLYPIHYFVPRCWL